MLVDPEAMHEGVVFVGGVEGGGVGGAVGGELLWGEVAEGSCLGS